MLTSTVISAHRHGPEWLGGGRCRFRLWAPSQATVALIIEGEPARPSMPRADGWHEWVVADVAPHALYRFQLGTGEVVPDPASGFQPYGVQGPSELQPPDSHLWTDVAWQGRPWSEAVLYELHVGTFTPSGTFAGAIDKLDHLVGLGVTALQLMPVAQCPGSRNWGYDGVFPFACARDYGRPEQLKALVDAAHARGLMVLLDVVYNHFGPEGCQLHLHAPQFFAREPTPWGAAIDFDGPDSAPVREFFFQNALHWLQTFHLDGLRLDAVHAITDRGRRHFLEELAERVQATIASRRVHLVLENLSNEARWLRRTPAGEVLAYSAQWNDDVHHALHAAVTDERQGYYGDFAGDTERLGRALAEGFAFQGEFSRYRGRRRGEPSAALPPDAFVAFVQNHDQVGNRPMGDRIHHHATAPARRAAAAACLLLPQVPMLFMGEEWEAPQPFPFFCDYTGALAEAVRQGRRAKCARMVPAGAEALLDAMPDPIEVSTFESARLDWAALDDDSAATVLAWYRRILAVRHREVVPLLPHLRRGGAFTVLCDGQVSVEWTGRDRALSLDLNLSGHLGAPVAPRVGRCLWKEGGLDDRGRLLPWSAIWVLRPG